MVSTASSRREAITKSPHHDRVEHNGSQLIAVFSSRRSATALATAALESMPSLAAATGRSLMMASIWLRTSPWINGDGGADARAILHGESGESCRAGGSESREGLRSASSGTAAGSELATLKTTGGWTARFFVWWYR